VRRIADSHDRAKGRELARLRKASGLSQERVATRLGISPKQFGKYERGQSRIPAGRYEAAMAILREYTGMVGGFSEGQAPYAFPAAAKDTLLRTLRELQAGLKLCIDVVERL
jgi:transcriptional regulator with XRE-family HTH domain